jgi:hypothetical protein
MTGYNHLSTCMCGWCVGGWRNHGSKTVAEPVSRPFWTVRWTYDSFTVPNVVCRYCNAVVFFHQAWNGGRVFFDALGPPWPKHECMAASSEPDVRSITADDRSLQAEHTPAWKTEGWTPIRVERTSREDEWHVLKCRRLDDDIFLRLLSVEPIEGVVRAPTLLSAMTPSGFATISFLHADGEPRYAPVYDYGVHCLSDPRDVESSRFDKKQ